MKFELEPYNHGLSDEVLLDDLRRVATQLGKSVLTRDEYGKMGQFHPATVANRFGGWLNAVGRAGLEKAKNHNVTADECVHDLQDVAARLDRAIVTISEYDAYGKYSSCTVVRRFGSWKDAIRAAGLTASPQFYERTTNEGYFQNLEKVWRTLGRQPKSTDMHVPLSLLSSSAYKRRFGTWRKTLQAFVDYANAPSVSPDKEGADNNIATVELRTRPSAIHRKTSRTISWRLRFVVMRRDDFKCCFCGISPALKPGVVLEVDHKVPWSKGGETVLENLQTLCQPCNGGKSNL